MRKAEIVELSEEDILTNPPGNSGIPRDSTPHPEILGIHFIIPVISTLLFALIFDLKSRHSVSLFQRSFIAVAVRV